VCAGRADQRAHDTLEGDRARFEALREEIGDEVIWQRFLARLRADPARYYPTWTS